MDPSGAGPSTAPRVTRLLRRRALGGAAVSVGGVLLGIASLLWVTDDPSQRLGPTVRSELPPLAQPAPLDAEDVPLDPPASPAPVAPSPVTLPSVSPSLPAPPEPSPSAAPESPASLVVPVTVLNNSRRDGLAARAADRFGRGGWPVALTGNFRGRIPVTTVYYDPGMEASARAFAATFDGITRVRPRFPTLPARGVVVVLTREFSA